MLIYPADRIAEIGESKKLGIEAKIKRVDFSSIMDRMRKVVEQGQRHMRLGLKHIKDLDLYETQAHFVEDYTLEVGGERIRGKKIFIVSGARPSIPPIKGLDGIEYLTNENVLQLQKRPKSLLIIGGGYIAVEYGHFFAAMGTRVTIVGRRSRLLSDIEPEIADLLSSKLSERMTIRLNTEIGEVRKKGGSVTAVGKDKKSGKTAEFSAERVMLAAGRTSNADILKSRKYRSRCR